MVEVVILVTDGVVLSSVALPVDVFNAAGRMWNGMKGEKITPYFSVRLASPGGETVNSYKSISITPDLAMEDVEQPDLLVIAASVNFVRPTASYHQLYRQMRSLYRHGTHLASVCTGAFLLAATGLLDGKSATTHWGLADKLQQRYPQVKVMPKRILTDEGDLYCSGGANAGGDLALHLVRKFCNSEVSYQCSRVLLLDPERISQAPYEIPHFEKKHGDEKVGGIQDWLERNFHKPFRVEELAARAAMSRRNFERRFKNATGESPLQYLQKIRIEKAKILLESTSDSFEQITLQTGYEDSSSFRKVFEKSTGLTPGSYRRRFHRYPQL